MIRWDAQEQTDSRIAAESDSALLFRRAMEFLNQANQHIASATTIHQLLKDYLELTAHCFNGSCAFYKQSERGELELVHSSPFESPEMKGAVSIRCGSRRPYVFTISTKSRCLETEDLILAQELASRLVMALERLTELEDLRRAIRIRDEVLSLSSHEIRTPLTSLRLLMDLLLRIARDPVRFGGATDRVLEILRGANLQVDQTSAVLDQLLDLSRLDSGKIELTREPVDMRGLAEDAIDILRAQLDRERIKIQLLTRDRAMAVGDPIRLRQVLINLITNAMKYGGGSPIEIQIERVDSQIRTFVIDRGSGVPSEIRSQIFDCFDRGKILEDGRGHGLGLYICRKIVEAHGGRISVEETRPHGATFVVELPAGRQATG